MARGFIVSTSALFIAALLFVACAGSSQPPAGQAPAAAPAAQPTGNVGSHMTDHFTKVREVEEAVIRGDVDAAHASAQWLADHQETGGLPAGTDTYVGDMKNAARAVASTDVIGNAAVAAASLVGTCGACHQAAKVTLAIPPLIAPATAGDIVSHMRQHQYAVDLMYRGLVVPSDELWTRGAEALKAAPLSDKDMSKVSKDVMASEARVHELADRAAKASDRGARVAIYGEVIGSCASCHGLHGKVWGPGLPKTQ